MTERLYYTEPYRAAFTAHVMEQLTWNDHPAVVLNRTAFYPLSGGQPADRGELDGTEVIDVVERDSDRAVVHVLSHRIVQGEVRGEIDWPRRFDHMQQHTGQHILSAAFLRELDGDTVGFHIGEADGEGPLHGPRSSTIDIDLGDLGVNDIASVEALSNRVIWEDRPISVCFAGEEELAELSIRRPAEVEGPVRLVEIGGNGREVKAPFDLNPCGGTHVARTGEIGIIKLTGLEHRGKKTRIEFLCGNRALRDYKTKHAILSALAKTLTVGYWELEPSIERLLETNKELRRTERGLQQSLLDLETQRLLEEAVAQGEFRVIGKVWDGKEPDALGRIARGLAEQADVVALLFSVCERTHMCFTRGEAVDVNMNRLLQKACGRLGGKGGGRPNAAQGSAPAADLTDVEGLVRELETLVASL
jgi:alanyl-tRNA synthetase